MADHDKAYLAETNGGSLVSTAAIFLVLSWISVGLRMYTRVFILGSFQVGDWLILIAQVLFTASCVFILAGVREGIGHHNVAITDDSSKVLALMWQALATATYVLDMMFIKLSIGVFLLQLSAQKVYRHILWVSLVVITIWSSVTFFWDVFQCKPVAKQWDYRVRHGHCVSAEEVVSAAYAVSVMTILSDWLFALLPIPILWNVKMTRQAKITVIVILGLGIFASIATLIRLRFLADLENMEDILYAGTDAMVWTLVEPGVAIVASCLATIRPLLRVMKIRGFESTDHAYGTGRSGTFRPSRQESTFPGYGPNELSLNEVESNMNVDDTPNSYKPKRKQYTLTRDSTMVFMTTHADLSREGRNMGQATPENDSESEGYIIERPESRIRRK